MNEGIIMMNKLEKQDIKAYIVKNCSDINDLAGVLLMFGNAIIESLNSSNAFSESNLDDIENISYMLCDISTEINKNAYKIANILQNNYKKIA